MNIQNVSIQGLTEHQRTPVLSTGSAHIEFGRRVVETEKRLGNWKMRTLQYYNSILVFSTTSSQRF
ncbi:hypothetical protein Phum_PHUM441270 [Pediculus humanus corporis]|uniref:Uncharacterized protein n=1 Tax=Pediculus humanus subsp. corporis TaxID=121224 RepID=E0VU08_PEDHC|nr:uncharacterized protein Phum_PHUM441270 [Pediculus humanus corporis]EEB16864.1 hypothetical protein Phum_PHUM441270 [Pediculus humanus corporis]